MATNPGEYQSGLAFFGVQPGDRCGNCALLLDCARRITAVPLGEPSTLDSMNAASDANDLTSHCPKVPGVEIGSTALVSCVSTSPVNKQ